MRQFANAKSAIFRRNCRAHEWPRATCQRTSQLPGTLTLGEDAVGVAACKDPYQAPPFVDDEHRADLAPMHVLAGFPWRQAEA
jgi:hypothetical protein